MNAADGQTLRIDLLYLSVLLMFTLTLIGHAMMTSPPSFKHGGTAPVLMAALSLTLLFGILNPGHAQLATSNLYEQYITLSQDHSGEYLMQHSDLTDSSAYYFDAPIALAKNTTELASHLAHSSTRWAMIKRESFPTLASSHYRDTGSHLTLANALGSDTLLVTNKALTPATTSSQPLNDILYTEPRPGTQMADITFNNAIKLIGYHIEDPKGRVINTLARGQEAYIVWQYQCLKQLSGSWQAFTHLELGSTRINTRKPVAKGLFPVSAWKAGDVILDKERITVPHAKPEGRYTLWTGFFKDNTRLKVNTSLTTQNNRVNVGQISVQ